MMCANCCVCETDNAVLSDISLAAGPSAGGSIVTVSGSGFYAAARCKFGTISDAGVTVSSSTQIVCQSPAQTAGGYSLEVTNNDKDTTDSGTVFVFYCTLLSRCGPTRLTVHSDRNDYVCASVVRRRGRRHDCVSAGQQLP